MAPKALCLLAGVSCVAAHLLAQSVSFDFDNAPFRSSLPISLSIADFTAQFSATGQGYSVQRADTLGFTPAGFSGLCLYPNSVFAADLLVGFSRPVTDFSILYAPEEYACDSSARLRVTAFMDAVQVGTATTNAQAGTWPSETLAVSPGRAFNKVVVHYDAPPPTGGDWGPIFMVDNMVVTPGWPFVLFQPEVLSDGSFRFQFSQAPGGAYGVFSNTNIALPFVQWIRLGSATEVSPGQYQFTDARPATGSSGCFYRVALGQ